MAHGASSADSDRGRSHGLRSAALAVLLALLASCGPKTSAAAEARRALTLARDGHLEESATAWRAALDREDTDAFRLELARVLVRLERPEEAAKEYQTVLGRRPVDASVWLEFGHFARGPRHDLRGAELAFRKAVELAPENAEAHRAWGLVLILLSDFEGATAELQAALSLAPAEAPWRQEVQNALVEAHLRKRDAENRAAAKH